MKPLYRRVFLLAITATCCLLTNGCSERHDLHDKADLTSVFKEEFQQAPGDRFDVREYRYNYRGDVTSTWMAFGARGSDLEELLKKSGWRPIAEVDGDHAGRTLYDAFSGKNPNAPPWWPRLNDEDINFYVSEQRHQISKTGKILWFDPKNNVVYLYRCTW